MRILLRESGIIRTSGEKYVLFSSLFGSCIRAITESLLGPASAAHNSHFCASRLCNFKIVQIVNRTFSIDFLYYFNHIVTLFDLSVIIIQLKCCNKRARRCVLLFSSTNGQIISPAKNIKKIDIANYGIYFWHIFPDLIIYIGGSLLRHGVFAMCSLAR